MRFHGSVKRDAAIDAWMRRKAGELGDIARECRPETATNTTALHSLIDAAYADIEAHVENG